MFKVPIKNTDTVSVSLLPTLNNVQKWKTLDIYKDKIEWYKIEKLKLKAFKMKKYDERMMRMRIEIGNRMKI